MNSIKSFLIYTLDIYQLIILVRVLMSWFPESMNNRFGYIIHSLTEPLLGFIRNLMPRTGMVDLSPLIAFFLLSLLQELIVRI